MEPTIQQTCCVTDQDPMVYFKTLYQPGFERVARTISKMGGSFEEARDIFHDALIVRYEQLERGISVENEVAYVHGIAKNLWLKKLSAEPQREFLHDNIAEHIDADVNEHRLVRILERAGRRCMDLLTAFYFSDSPIQELQQQFGFSSEHSASVQKYKCLEKIKQYIKTKSLRYEDFLN